MVRLARTAVYRLLPRHTDVRQYRWLLNQRAALLADDGSLSDAAIATLGGLLLQRYPDKDAPVPAAEPFPFTLTQVSSTTQLGCQCSAEKHTPHHSRRAGDVEAAVRRADERTHRPDSASACRQSVVCRALSSSSSRGRSSGRKTEACCCTRGGRGGCGAGRTQEAVRFVRLLVL